MVLTIEFVDEILKCDHSSEGYWALFSGETVIGIRTEPQTPLLSVSIDWANQATVVDKQRYYFDYVRSQNLRNKYNIL